MSSAASASAGSKDRDATVSQEVLVRAAAASPPGSSALRGVEHSDSGSVPSRRVKARQMVNKFVLERSSAVRDQWGCEAVAAVSAASAVADSAMVVSLLCIALYLGLLFRGHMQFFASTVWFQSVSAVKKKRLFTKRPEMKGR